MSSNTPANGTAGGSNNNSTSTSNSNSNSNNSNTNNGTRNNRRNNNNSNTGQPWRTNNHQRSGADALRNFKGAVESLPVLGTKSEKANQDYSKFTKSILNHVLTNFTHPQDIAYAITDLKDPTKRINQDLPTTNKLLKDNDLVLEDVTTGTGSEKASKVARNAEIEEVVDYMRKAAFTEFNKRKTAAVSNKAALWGLVMGQCTTALQQLVKAEDGYDSNVYNPVWLLSNIKKAISGVTKQSNIYHTAFHVMKDFYKLRQKKDESVQDYVRRFEAQVDLIKLAHTEAINPTGLLKVETDQDPNLVVDDVYDRFLAMAFLENACTTRFAGLWTDMQNGIAMKTDKYPKTLEEAIFLLTHYKGPQVSRRNNDTDTPRNQYSFIQGAGFQGEPLICQQITDNKNDDGTVKGTDGQTRSHVQCHNCGWKGHYAPKCPAPRQERSMYIFFHFNFNQTHLGGLSITTIIIDTGSTFNSFFNRRLLENIKSCNGIRAYSNGGSMDYNEGGDVSILPALTAYHNDNSLANILSMKEVAKYYRVIMDTEQNSSIFVFISETEYLEFEQLGNGLYCFDTVRKPKQTSDLLPLHTCLFSTVAANKASYSLREVQGAELARTLQGRVGWPSDEQFKNALVTPGTFHNVPITRDDVVRAHDITGGPAYQLLKGKSVRRKKKVYNNVPKVNIEAPLLLQDRTDELDTDFMYVQGKPYLVTLSRNIIFQSLQSFNRISKIKGKKIFYQRGKTDMAEGLNKVVRLYNDKGVTIDVIHADGEFRKVEDLVKPTDIECCSAREHIDRIERRIRVIKERTRCYWVDLPYKKAPKIMVDENLFEINEWLNAYPYKRGVSGKYSPGAMMQGKQPVDMQTLKVTFGAYCEVYDGTDNTNKERRMSCIALRPCNKQGGYYFLNLETGRKVHAYDWIDLAISDRVIDMVHKLADKDKSPALDEQGCPVFEIDIGNDDLVPLPEGELEEGFEDNAVVPPPPVLNNVPLPPIEQDTDEDSSSVDSNSSYDSSDESDVNEHYDNDDSEPNNEDEQPSDADDTDDREEDEVETHDQSNDESDSEEEVDISDSEEEVDISNNDSNVRSDNDDSEVRSDNDDSEVRSDNDEEARSGNDRPRRNVKPPDNYEPSMSGKSYSFMQQGSDYSTQKSLYTTAVNVIFNQMHASKGIKLFKEKAVAAMFKEYKQLNDMDVVIRVAYDKLSDEQKRNALDAVNLIKEKRCGKIKGRTCANGSPQRAYVPREEASSPTLSLEALLSLFIIFGHEKRSTAVFDVPGAYLHADLPPGKFVLLKITGEFVDIMCEVNPEFKQDVRYENGKKVLYVQVNKAIYGMIESALLWYELYVTVLLDEGFELNEYDKCVANKVINGKQCTLGWYVDDNIIGHVEDEVLDEVIAKIEDKFPGLVVQKGRKLDFLGMEIFFREDGKVAIGTVQFLKNMIKEFEEETGVTLNRIYTTPAAPWLFKVKKNAKSAVALCEKFTSFFRKYTMKNLWASKRSRPDNEPTMGFLTTRMKEPTKDDWHKLVRLMSFVKATVEDVRIIGADDLHSMLTMVDSAHAVHEKDMRGHTGSVITMGTGVIDTKSSKQKMNTRSSTECEFVGTSEALPRTIFRNLFMEGQGYEIKWNVLAKDNESEIRMLNNGRDSCTWNSKHIAIKYFWVTDRIEDGNIVVQYCPTTQMIGDFMSKPVQGRLFQTFRNVIMGWAHISSVFEGYIHPEERVEDSIRSSLTPDGDVTKMKRMKRKLAKAKVQQQNREILNEISLNRKNPISDNV